MADRPPLRGYASSRAVVMGTWQYEFLDAVPAAENSLRRMAGLLAGPLCGWPRERLLVLPNEPNPGDLPDRLITAFDGIRDVAVFYYVGHGQIAPDDQLCLGLVQSRREANRRTATSLRFSDVRQALQESGAAIKIVILDSCFAGLATAGSPLAGLAGDVLDDLTAGTGAYTMAATGAYATAWYEDGPGLLRPQTYFTKYFVDLIERGIPGQPSRLRLDPLFKQLRDDLAAARRPVPHRRAVDDARDFAFAHNAAPPRTHRDPEREVAQLTQLLAESDAEKQALRAEAAERAAEVARLKEQMANAQRPTAEQQRELQHAIDQATRRLDDAQAALPQNPEYGPPRRPTVPITAGWALWGWGRYEGYGVVECSDGPINRKNFEEVLRRFSLGELEYLPHVSVSYLPGGGDHDYIALAIHERAERPDDYGRPAVRTRYFCVPYAELAAGHVGYQAMYDRFSKISLPVYGGRLIEARLPEAEPSTTTEETAMAAAAMLLTGGQVGVLGADWLDLGTRLRFLDSVASLLPYGMRVRLSAATRVSRTLRHDFRLFFTSTGASQRPGDLMLAWGQDSRTPIGHPNADTYLNWLREGDIEQRSELLSTLTEPASFSESSITDMLERLGAVRHVSAFGPTATPSNTQQAQERVEDKSSASPVTSARTTRPAEPARATRDRAANRPAVRDNRRKAPPAGRPGSRDPVVILVGWIGRIITGTWMAVAEAVGYAVRAVGRGARGLEPHHRRDGTGLFILFVAVTLGFGVWGWMGNTAGRDTHTAAVDAFGSLSWLIPLLVLLLAWRFLRHPERNTGTTRAVIGWTALLVAVCGLLEIANGTPRPSHGASAMRAAGGFVGYAVSGPLTVALTPFVAAPLLVLLALFGLMVISGTPLHRVPGRLTELRMIFESRRRRGTYDAGYDLDIRARAQIARQFQIAKQARLRPAAEAGEHTSDGSDGLMGALWPGGSAKPATHEPDREPPTGPST